MLKNRIITAVCVSLLILSLLFTLPIVAFQGVVAVVFALGAWEWAALSKINNKALRVVYALCVFTAMLIAGYFLGLFSVANETYVKEFVGLGCIFWAFALLWVLSYPGSAVIWSSPLFVAVMGFFVLVPASAALFYLLSLENGQWLFLFLIAIVSCADIGAYFTGKQWGKKKMLPKVSPGKSWAGLLGGLSCVGAFSFILAHVVTIFEFSVITLTVVSIITVLSSVLGDLVESMVKRQAGKKDSSNLLPGHGGIMDRIDSVTAAAPVFVLLSILV